RITVDLQLPAAARLAIGVYNVAGQRVQTLANGLLTAGPHRIIWDGRTQNGMKAANGVYLIRLQGAGFGAVRKAVVVR
ncbi:MAG TPA: FlgD immunoglobulin-like domain containing protein, partial [Candidatus Edwardsbacteria bacterium]|nr:FlgD immunoglobulin-like domain containing protein [Candidatus Edwardsbacteria bacterium]